MPSWESYCAKSCRRDWPPMTVDFAVRGYCCTSAGSPGAVSSARNGVTWAVWRALYPRRRANCPSSGPVRGAVERRCCAGAVGGCRFAERAEGC